MMFSLLLRAPPTPKPFQLLFDKKDPLKGGCYRIPSLTTAADGTLIAFADQRYNHCGDLNSNDEIKIVGRFSTDNGATWSPVQRFVDFPKGASASDCSSVLNKVTSEIVLMYNYMEHLNQIYKHHIRFSSNGGKNWSDPIDITDQIMPPGAEKHFKFITSGKIAQAQNGYLYQTLVDYSQGGCYIIQSKNHGRNWTLFSGLNKPADETTILVLDNGNILINARWPGSGKRYFYEYDPDGNLVHSEPRPDLPDPACDASFINYHAGDRSMLLFSNPNSNYGRKNMTIKFSKDSGKTFSSGKQIYPGESQYSSLSPMRNDDLGLLFESLNDQGGLVFQYLPIDWVLDQ